MSLMLINKKMTLCTIIEFDGPIIESLLLMNAQKGDFVKLSKFEIFLKMEIDKIKLRLSNRKDLDLLIDKIKRVYSISNLKNNNIIIVDDGDSSLSFVSHIYDMFSDLLDSMKIKPITDRVFVNHIKYLNGLIKDSLEYNSYNQIEKETYLEDVHLFLRKVKQDFDKNRKIIIRRSENLSKFFEDESDSPMNKNEVMEEIIVLCEKYIEPFHNFLMNYNKQGFLFNLSKFKQFFIVNNLREEDEISRFIVSYASYRKDIKIVFDKINDYRRKCKKDFIVYNSFEREFNALSEAVLDLQDGKRTKNHISSSDYHEGFNRFDNLKVNNSNGSEISVNYINLPERFTKIEDQFLIEFEFESENKPEDKFEKEITQEDRDKSKKIKLEYEKSQINMKLEDKLSKIISKNMKYIQLDDGIDILFKINKALSVNISDYKVSHLIYCYFLVRDQLKGVEVHHNKKHDVVIGDSCYTYRPVYSKRKS